MSLELTDVDSKPPGAASPMSSAPSSSSDGAADDTIAQPPDPAGRKLRALLREEAEARRREQEAVKPLAARRTCSFTCQVVATACLSSLLFGYNVALTNTTAPHTAWDLAWCRSDTSTHVATDCPDAQLYYALLTSIIFAGAVTGSVSATPCLKKGRKFAVLVSLAVYALGAVTAATANSASAHMWARFLSGIGVGISSGCVPVYISEMSPRASRGFYGVLHQVSIVTGIFLAVLLGLPLPFAAPVPDASEVGGWQAPPRFVRVWLRCLQGLPCLLAVYGAAQLAWLHRSDTPHWHVEHGETAKAAQVLARLVASEEVEAELLSLRADHEVQKHERGRKALFSKKFRNLLGTATLLAVAQQLTGINAFTTSSAFMLQEAGFSPKMAAVCTAAVFLANVLVTVGVAPLIDRVGRRTLLLVGCAGQFIALAQAAAILWTTSEKVGRYSALAATVVFILFFAMSLGPVVWVYIFEIFPTSVKRQAVSIAVSANWITSGLVTAGARVVPIKFQFTIFSALALAVLVWVSFAVKETKGLRLGDPPS